MIRQMLHRDRFCCDGLMRTKWRPLNLELSEAQVASACGPASLCLYFLATMFSMRARVLPGQLQGSIEHVLAVIPKQCRRRPDWLRPNAHNGPRPRFWLSPYQLTSLLTEFPECL